MSYFELHVFLVPSLLFTRRDVPVGVPLDLSTPYTIIMEWHKLPKYIGIQVSQLI